MHSLDRNGRLQCGGRKEGEEWGKTMEFSEGNLEYKEFLINNTIRKASNKNGGSSVYTWCNNHVDAATRIYKELDKVLINSLAWTTWGHNVVSKMGRSGSDHSPIIFPLIDSSTSIKGNGFFRFQSYLLRYRKFMTYLTLFWTGLSNWRGNFMSAFIFKLAELRGWIEKWTKNYYRDFNVHINQVQEVIEGLKARDLVSRVDGEEWEHLMRLMAWEKNLHNDKDSVAKFRLKMDWIKDGDVSSRFFHDSIKMTSVEKEARARAFDSCRIILTRVIDLFGNLWNQPEELLVDGVMKQEFLNAIRVMVSVEHNESLTRDLDMEKLDRVVKQLEDGKCHAL